MHPLLRYLRRYLWIDGRAGRREWWATMILVLMLGVQLDVSSIFARPLFNASVGVDGAIRMALSLLLFWIDLASTIRRVHDRGKAGWSALPFLIPGIGWMWMVVACGILPSQSGYNAYGPEPGSAGHKLARQALFNALTAGLRGQSTGPWMQATPAPAVKPAATSAPKSVPKSSEVTRAGRPETPRDNARSQRRRGLTVAPHARAVQPTGGVVRRNTSAVTRTGDAAHSRLRTVLVLAAVAIAGFLFMAYAMNGIAP